MAKKKVIAPEETIMETETTEDVDFEDLSLQIYKPTLSKDKAVTVTGNFEELQTKIIALVNKYKDTKLTATNLNVVKALHRQFTSLRTAIEKERKDYEKIYINPAKTSLKAMCDELIAVVTEGEQNIKEQLDKVEEQRINDVKRALDEFVNECTAEHNLRDEWKSKVVLKKEFFNKTQDENDSLIDIENQCKELKKKQDEYDAAVTLIKGECEGTTLIVDNYLAMLNYRSAMEIVLQIKADKKKTEEIVAEIEKSKEENKPYEIGVKKDTPLFEHEDLGSVPSSETGSYKMDKFKERKLWIRYPAELGEDIADFFSEKGIQYKFFK